MWQSNLQCVLLQFLTCGEIYKMKFVIAVHVLCITLLCIFYSRLHFNYFNVYFILIQILMPRHSFIHFSKRDNNLKRKRKLHQR